MGHVTKEPTMATRYPAAAIAALVCLILPAVAGAASQPRLHHLGTHESGLFNVGGAEIPTYDPFTRRAFVVNAGSATIDVLDLRDPSRPDRIASLDVVADLAPRSVGAANSVDTRFGLLAVAIEANPKQDVGARSFTIWDANTLTKVFDSGSELEQTLANLLPAEFNSNHEENGSFDNRSDNKGPEPEGVTVGWVHGRPYAFIGLERIGGIMVYDLSDPRAPLFVDYVNNRRFRDAAGLPVPTCAEFDPPTSTAIGDCVRPNSAAGDLGPEGIRFVPAVQSPTRKPLVIVGNEVSGTTTVYEFR
ncbi:MAG: choice-of-anchor I domain-containing protein [Dongiaceae bacterium]